MVEHWHAHHNWKLEVHEGKNHDDPTRMHQNCKTIAKFSPDNEDDVDMLIAAHNAAVEHMPVKSWEEAFTELHGH